MPATLALEVVTPERLLLRLRVAYVYAHGEAGDFCVLPRHMPLLTVLRVGSLHYRLDGKVHFVFVRGGIFTVCRDAALVLAEVAELPMEIDVDRAQKARERALARLESDRRVDVDYIRARAALQRAIARIQVHEEAGLAGTRAWAGPRY